MPEFEVLAPLKQSYMPNFILNLGTTAKPSHSGRTVPSNGTHISRSGVAWLDKYFKASGS